MVRRFGADAAVAAGVVAGVTYSWCDGARSLDAPPPPPIFTTVLCDGARTGDRSVN